MILEYLRAHWNGEQRLAQSYWLNGVLLSVVLTGALFLVPVDRLPVDQTRVAVGFLLIAVLGSITVWQLVGIWRSASNSSRTTGRSFWPFVAKVLVVLGAIGAIANLGTAGRDFVSLSRELRSPELTDYHIKVLGETDLLFSGAINERSVDQLISLLSADDNISILRINSHGGLIEPAMKLARYVQQKDVFVMAEGNCVSSCILILAASPYAAIYPETKVVFHRSESVVDHLNPDMQKQLQESLVSTMDYYRAFGIPEWAIKNMENQVVWSPTVSEQVSMGLVQLVFEPEKRQFVSAESYCADHSDYCG